MYQHHHVTGRGRSAGLGQAGRVGDHVDAGQLRGECASGHADGKDSAGVQRADIRPQCRRVACLGPGRDEESNSGACARPAGPTAAARSAGWLALAATTTGAAANRSRATLAVTASGEPASTDVTGAGRWVLASNGSRAWGGGGPPLTSHTAPRATMLSTRAVEIHPSIQATALPRRRPRPRPRRPLRTNPAHPVAKHTEREPPPAATLRRHTQRYQLTRPIHRDSRPLARD